MAQPNYPLVAQVLQTLTDQANLIPNVPAIQGMQQINNRLDQIQQALQNVPTLQQINQLLNPIRADIAAIRAEQTHLPMKLFNCGLRPEGNLKYPPGIIAAAGNGLPVTYLGLLTLTAADCQLTAQTLGLLPLPNGSTVNQRRAQIAEFLGCPVQY